MTRTSLLCVRLINLHALHLPVCDSITIRFRPTSADNFLSVGIRIREQRFTSATTTISTTTVSARSPDNSNRALNATAARFLFALRIYLEKVSKEFVEFIEFIEEDLLNELNEPNKLNKLLGTCKKVSCKGWNWSCFLSSKMTDIIA